MTNDQYLEALMSEGSKFLGSRYAILGGAMAWVSNHKLVSAISNSGGFGVVASGAMMPEMLKTEIEKTQDLTKNTFAVNLIVMHPLIDQMLDICIDKKVSHVVLAGGLPSSSYIKKLKDCGIKVISFAPSLILAKKLVRSGIDAIILEGTEAGGHVGPTSTSVLVQEILPHIREVPIFIAGGIGRGEMMLSYLEMGAAGCQMGTVFACSKESPANESFKKSLMRAQARDAVASVQLDSRFPVIPVRSIHNKAMDNFYKIQRDVISNYENGEIELKDAQLEIEHYWAGALRKAVMDGDVEGGSLMAGQSVGLVTEERSIEEIISIFKMQALEALQNRSERVSRLAKCV